jgi:hypothetical protein
VLLRRWPLVPKGDTVFSHSSGEGHSFFLTPLVEDTVRVVCFDRDFWWVLEVELTFELPPNVRPIMGVPGRFVDRFVGVRIDLIGPQKLMAGKNCGCPCILLYDAATTRHRST